MQELLLKLLNCLFWINVIPGGSLHTAYSSGLDSSFESWPDAP